jgi:predicted transcriptional regulator
MDQSFPSAAQIQAELSKLSIKQMDRLAELSGVPSTTIYKIKRGETANPGIETVRKFMPHIAAVVEAQPIAEPQHQAAA